MSDDSSDAEEDRLRKAVRLDRYADILAHVMHFGTDRAEEVVARFGLSLERWRSIDKAWTSELALGMKRQQREQALRFSAAFHGRRQRLVRQHPPLDSIGDASQKADPDLPESPPPNVATQPSGVPSFMLVPATPPSAPPPASSSPWARGVPITMPAVSPAITPAPAPAPSSKPLPFLEGIPASAALQSAVEHAHAIQGAPSPAVVPIGMTAPASDDISTIARKILPFTKQSPSEPPPSREVELTLEQHASLHVDLEMMPEQEAETLRRYGLSAKQHARLDEDWEARIALDPRLAAAWQQAIAQYRAWLSSTRAR